MKRIVQFVIPIDLNISVLLISSLPFTGDNLEPRAISQLWTNCCLFFGGLGLVRGSFVWVMDDGMLLLAVFAVVAPG